MLPQVTRILPSRFHEAGVCIWPMVSPAAAARPFCTCGGWQRACMGAHHAWWQLLSIPLVAGVDDNDYTCRHDVVDNAQAARNYRWPVPDVPARRELKIHSLALRRRRTCPFLTIMSGASLRSGARPRRCPRRHCFVPGERPAAALRNPKYMLV